MNKQIVIFSCNFGNYDKVRDPIFIDSNVSYILFSDRPQPHLKCWKTKIISLSELNSDPQRVARYIKLNPHLFLPKGHKISVWVDSCYQIKVFNFISFINQNLRDKDICLFRHPKRNCVYEEIDVCNKKKLDYSIKFQQQKEEYLKEGLPYNFGLYHTAVLVRRNNKEIENFNKLWWKELNIYSKRDQISFSYCLWKFNFIPNIIKDNFGVNLYTSNQFRKFKHIKNRVVYD